MIDDKTGIFAATAQSIKKNNKKTKTKQVIWDLQAPSIGIISPHVRYRTVTPPHSTHTPPSVDQQQSRTQNMHRRLCTRCVETPALPPPSLSLFLWCTLRQLSAELLRRQPGTLAHQQRGRGAVSLMSTKAVYNTGIATRSCVCAHVCQLLKKILKNKQLNSVFPPRHLKHQHSAAEPF